MSSPKQQAPALGIVAKADPIVMAEEGAIVDTNGEDGPTPEEIAQSEYEEQAAADFEALKQFTVHDLPVPEGEHQLQSAWTFWFMKNQKNSQNQTADQYETGLTTLGSFNTVESFWRFYTHLKRPRELPKDCNMHLFREAMPPMWETFPRGGCWILKVPRKNTIISRYWEELLIACITECFEEPDVVGIVLSMRPKENLLSVWNRDSQNHIIRFKIGDKIKQILQLDNNTLIEYKNFSLSIRDGSTFRNAKPYVLNQ